MSISNQRKDREKLNFKDIDSEPVKQVLNVNSNGLLLSRGLIANQIGKTQYGHNHTIAVNTDPEDIVPHSKVLTLADFSTTANIDSVSCTTAGYTGTVEVVGLDANWDYVTQQVQLNGQNTVLLTTPLIRVESGIIIDTALPGDLYVFTNGAATTNGVPNDSTTIRLNIHEEDNLGHSGIISIPAGYTGYLVNTYISQISLTKGNAELRLCFKLFGRELIYSNGYSGLAANGTSGFDFTPPFPVVLPEKSDTWQRVQQVDNAMGISFASRYILVKNGV